jgi:penicillin-binding protein 2
MGTANSAHLEGIDFAGKTGSAQTMSNVLAQRLGHAHSMKDNAWFVGVTPRRNPSLVVAVLFEGGEHGQFAGRIAAQVVKAYVEKQRRVPVKVASMKSGRVEVAGVWNDPHGDDGNDMQGGRFYVDVARAARRPAEAAPGEVMTRVVANSRAGALAPQTGNVLPELGTAVPAR